MTWRGAVIPYWIAHLLALVGVFIVPLTPDIWGLLAFTYFARIFAITAGYHRYFAHRSFKTGRLFQFLLALGGTFASQKGVLWWAGWHRHHHKHSDGPEDVHSPRRGFWWSHQGWFLVPDYDETPARMEEEFRDYPEILWLNEHWGVPPIAGLVAMYLLGGLPWLFWGGLFSTILVWHGTFTINSLAHVWGTRRFETTDTSRNNPVLALLTMGEGWHNNHHAYQSSARQGFRWYELDLSYVVLWLLSKVGIVWDLRQPPAWLLEGRPSARAAPAE